MTSTEPTPPTLLSRAQQALSTAVLVFLLSWLVPLAILATPMLARSYVHTWKVVLGIEPDCVFPASPFRWRAPDCADLNKASKKMDRLQDNPAK